MNLVYVRTGVKQASVVSGTAVNFFMTGLIISMVGNSIERSRKGGTIKRKITRLKTRMMIYLLLALYVVKLSKTQL